MTNLLPNALLRLRRCEKGQDAVEYALATAVFSLLLVATFPGLMTIVDERFSGVTSLLASVAAR